MIQEIPWTRRLSTKLIFTAALLLGVSLSTGTANLWAFQQLEQDTVRPILRCGADGGNDCRELGRSHLDRLHLLQYAFMALSISACGLVTWLAVGVRRRVQALGRLSERLARGEPVEPVDGRDDLAAIGRSIGSTVRKIEREHATERAALGDRIDALVALSKTLADHAGGGLPSSLQSSGRFAVAAAATADGPALQGRVLLVDDDPDALRGFARILKARGHHVAMASQGTEAMTKLSEGRFDVIVSDIAMPGMDGIQLLREVRRRDLLVPVILITGKPAVKTAAEAVEIGAFQYLIKPIQSEHLCQVVEHGIRVGRMGRIKQEAAELLGQTAALGADRVGLEVSFERTLETLWMAFQPIVNARTLTVYAFESLLRSNEPSLPHPGAVLDAAERLGRLDALGRITRAKSASEVARATDVPRLFVNLHVRDLLDPDLLDPDAALSKIARRVVLEITERSSLEDVRDARIRVAALREMGFRIAVDDMGAGYAGLSSFALLEPDVVKLDMSLVRDVHESATKRRVIRSMTELSKGMGMEVIAEGVETVEERDTLIDLGCDLLQGYLFAKPGKPFPNVDWGNLQVPVARAASFDAK